MKKLLYTLALVVIAMTASYAQKPGKGNKKEQASAEVRAEKAAAAMQLKLNLTADQKAQLKDIEIDRIKKNDEWRKNDQTAMKNKMEERKSFMKANKDKVDAVLTADQKKILAASRSEMKDKMKNRKGDKGKKSPKDLTQPQQKSVN